VIHCAREIRVRKRYSPVRSVAQDVTRCRLAVDAEKEARLRIHVGVSPAIEYDPRNVPARIEAARGEHVIELFA